jgi:hypothetical protein
MKQKLFENIGGNTFKLITESVDEVNPNAKLVRSGLKKVFSAGDKTLSYKRLQGVGLGYIKSVEEAKKTAIQEARELAKEYGYMDNESAQAFVKEDEHDRIDPNQRWDKVPQHSGATPMGSSEKSKTVDLAEDILEAWDDMVAIPSVAAALPQGSTESIRSRVEAIIQLNK